jgi:hypothetical protein
MVLGVMMFATGCEERDRLTFPNPGDGIGPVTMIDQPGGSDTTVPAGPGFFVYGRTIDSDGVDTVYFLVTGETFPPHVPTPRSDTVQFGLPITTFGHSGDTILVEIHGVDARGNQGAVSSRRIIVQ